ncbi:hypothetical protein BFP70_18410 [Thioclava sp. SK-1]|nr:hypothetical protein BFP70_18410 [Thioclava sp. SK-1]
MRLILLAFNQTQLFVDETQYWYWGQHLDFGYYSKPPFIGWLLRGVTDLAGSDSMFWIRMPGAILHGITALLLGTLAARLADGRAGLWAAALYVTLPFVAVGSLLISTDTVMAPFYAGALLFFVRAAQGSGLRDAAFAGLCGGAAFMSKYAAIYLIPGMGLAALVSNAYRVTVLQVLVMAICAAIVIAPNVLWNLSHDLTTVEHTMDNAGWVRDGAQLNWGSLAEFFFSQFAVFGPVTMVGLLLGYGAVRNPVTRGLIMLSFPPLLVVLVQAFLDKAYANWAVATYFAGTVLVVLVLRPRWLKIALGINLVIAVMLPVLTVLAPWPEWKGQPLMKRYLGREEQSAAILDIAQGQGLPVYAQSRDILADLFHAGQGLDVTIWAPQPQGRAHNYYEQMHPLPTEYRGEVLMVARDAPQCYAPAYHVANLPNLGAWSGHNLSVWRVSAGCLNAGG